MREIIDTAQERIGGGLMFMVSALFWWGGYYFAAKHKENRLTYFSPGTMGYFIYGRIIPAIAFVVGVMLLVVGIFAS